MVTTTVVSDWFTQGCHFTWKPGKTWNLKNWAKKKQQNITVSFFIQLTVVSVC